MLLPFSFCSRGERRKRDERERKREIEEMGERGRRRGTSRSWNIWPTVLVFRGLVGIINCFISALIRASPFARLSKYRRRNPHGDVRA